MRVRATESRGGGSPHNMLARVLPWFTLFLAFLAVFQISCYLFCTMNLLWNRYEQLGNIILRWLAWFSRSTGQYMVVSRGGHRA
jgi:hypothetical protein